MLTGPRPLVICGPSGTGKGTLLNKLLHEYPNSFGFSISHTTRKPRPKEIDGKHYHFTTKEMMDADVKAGKFIETATFSGNMYGTSKTSVEDVRKNGKICILEIEIEGAKQVKKTNLNAHFVFIKPPSVDELKNRLERRNTESKESLDMRLNTAIKEIEYGKLFHIFYDIVPIICFIAATQPGNFDAIIINDNLEHAYQQLKEYVENNVIKKSL